MAKNNSDVKNNGGDPLLNIKETLKNHFFSVLVNKPIKRDLFIFFSCFHSKGYPRSKNWTLDLEPAFSPRFSPTLSPRSFFHTRQRFPIQNHVTSGCMSPRSSFPTGQRFPILKTRDFRFRVMTSLICSRPIRSQEICHTSPMYYS